MSFLFDFGLSQEDPLSEQDSLEIRPSDRIISLASAGEVALSLLSLNNDIFIKAVDISESQIRLCRLKLLSALYIDFPLNGYFLGYSRIDKKTRNDLYHRVILPHLSESDAKFWNQNISYIKKGIINGGRFEQYIGKMRFVANMFIGKRNIRKLIDSQSLDEQKKVFHDHIETRKSLQLLFRIAFHPHIYKKRGLQEQALIHADKSTGDRFYSRFKGFCTGSLASENYFMQFFLTGNCINEKSFPPYLQPFNKVRLTNNFKNLELKNISFQDAICETEKGYFNKIHLSNLGDWLSEDQFNELKNIIKTHCDNDTHICYRYLQKNHFSEAESDGFITDKTVSANIEARDRFPIYNILSLKLKMGN